MSEVNNNSDVIESKEEKPEEIKAKFSLVNPFNNSNVRTSIQDRYELGITPIPPGNSREIDEIYSIYTSESVKIEDLVHGFEDEDPETGEKDMRSQAALRLIDNIKTAGNNHQGNYGEEIINGRAFNSLKLGEESLDMREVKISSISPAKLKQEDRINRFKAMIGAGTTVSIPLYHSGFRLIVSPPTQSELIQLEVEILKSEVNIGRDTIGFITSNRRGFGIGTMRDFILSKTIASTLDVDKENIFQYVSILDLDAIILGLMASTYVNKISVSRSCINSIKVNDNGELICDKVVRADLDPYKLLFVNTSSLSGSMIAQIAKRKANSVTLEDLENYKSEMNSIFTERYKRKSVLKIEQKDQGTNYELELRVPSVDEYVNDASIWLDNIIADVDRIVAASSEMNKNTIMDRLVASKFIGMFNSNIRSVSVTNEMGDILEEEKEDRFIINSFLETITSSGEHTADIIEGITDFVNKSMNSLVATPNYVCPKCNTLQSEQTSTNKDFSELIPLNMLDFFFSLLGDRNLKMEVESSQKFSTL